MSARSRRRSRYAFLVLFLLLAGASACDLGTSPSGEQEEEEEQFPQIEGTWAVTVNGVTRYFVITAETLTEYFGVPGQCFISFVYDIVSRTGSTVTLTPSGTSESFTVTLDRNGDSLELNGGQLTFNVSTDNPAAETECGDSHPAEDATTACESLPQITLDVAIEDGLTTDDDWFEAFFDLYGLTVDADLNVTVDLVADDDDQLDTFLVLYSGDGTFVAFNDDADETTFNSSLTTDLTAGCYRVLATSFFSDELGPYTLTVTAN